MRGLTPATLRGRLALLALATTAIWVTLLTMVFNLALHAQLRRQSDDLLRTRAAAVAATLQTWPDGHIRVLEPSDDRALDVGVWIYQGYTAIERPRAPRGLQASADRMAGQRKTFMDLKTPYAWRVYSLPVMSEGRRVGTVVSAVDLDPYSDLARLALAGSATLTLLLLFGVYLLTRAVVRGALRPVTQMSEQATQWGEHGTHHRFGTQPGGDEQRRRDRSPRGARVHTPRRRGVQLLESASVLRGARKRAGLPACVTFHTLRHTYASLLIAAGTHLTVIRDRMGHASITITSDTYGHLYPAESDRTRYAIDHAFSDASPLARAA